MFYRRVGLYKIFPILIFVERYKYSHSDRFVKSIAPTDPKWQSRVASNWLVRHNYVVNFKSLFETVLFQNNNIFFKINLSFDRRKYIVNLRDCVVQEQ